MSSMDGTALSQEWGREGLFRLPALRRIDHSKLPVSEMADSLCRDGNGLRPIGYRMARLWRKFASGLPRSRETVGKEGFKLDHSFYATRYNTVELDNTFYRTPAFST